MEPWGGGGKGVEPWGGGGKGWSHGEEVRGWSHGEEVWGWSHGEEEVRGGAMGRR